MKSLLFKMVSRNVIHSDDVSYLLSYEEGFDPVLHGILSGLIDEGKLAKFYEYEGYSVIYNDGEHRLENSLFSGFFTPDLIARYLVVPISFKEDSKDIIVGFINSHSIPVLKQTINKIFPFSTTFFHIPYSIFKRIVFTTYLFDIEKYHATQRRWLKEKKLDVGDRTIDMGKLTRFYRQNAEQVFVFKKEKSSVVFDNGQIKGRFPLPSLPTLQNSLRHGYIEIDAGQAMSILSHTEKIMFFTNMKLKRNDKMVVISPEKEFSDTFFLLINPKGDRSLLESAIKR